MAQTTSYKNTAGVRHRYMQTEQVFTRGMKYTQAPHEEGYAKLLVNFNIKNDGAVFVPRGGLQPVQTEIGEQLLDPSLHQDYIIHHTGNMYVQFPDEVRRCSYLLASVVKDGSLLLKESQLILEIEEYRYLVAEYKGKESLTLPLQEAVTSMHDWKIQIPLKRKGLFTSLESNTYVLTSEYLGRIEVKVSSAQKATWEIKEVVPKEVQPAQALNYGYNMLKNTPYSFANVQTDTGDIVLTGVVPYSEQGELLLTARPGTDIDFKLYYKYPQKDSADKYLFQWEVQDLQSNAAAVVMQSVRDSVEVTPGEEVVFKYAPAFKHFSIVVKAYRKSEIAVSDAAWESNPDLQKLITKDANLKPAKVIALSSYHLTDSALSSTTNAQPVTYKMHTATGICMWQQRLVLWGVEGAPNTLFVSEVNDPSYIPFPNNSEIFSEDIIAAVPYLSSLLIFTNTALYKLTLNKDGLSYITECIQERLAIRKEDIGAIHAVQNMVYFKSDNYYYMVVPNTKSLNTTLQLAPVSRPIEYLLDDFEKSVQEILKEVYATQHPFTEINLIDYHSYVADTQVRCVYKLQAGDSLFIDLCLNYDTATRAWTTYIYETSKYRMEVYKPTVTGDTCFAFVRNMNYICKIGLVKFDEENPKDVLPLDHDKPRTIKNYQYINTGYRGFQTEHKKRFREIQFHLNSRTADRLKFYTAFVVDDRVKYGMYRYDVEHITDKSDNNYGSILVAKELIDEKETPMLTQLNTWELDAGQFPDLTVYKVRYRVAGKGYGGSIQLLSVNEVPYELLNMSWVFRILYAR